MTNDVAIRWRRGLSAGLATLLVLALCAGRAHAQGEDALVTGAQQDVDYLVGLIGNPAQAFDPAKVQNLLTLVSRASDDVPDLELEKRGKAVGAYWQFTLKTPVAKIGDYVYNPDIPPQAMLPGAVRLGGWRPESLPQARTTLGDVWSRLPGLPEPVVFRGVEHEETTPDPTSGVYYTYDMRRLLVLFNDKGRDVLLSVAKLKEPSAPGKKGAQVGQPRDWTFFYSGLEGNLLKGVSWADSHMYDSCSVFAFMQPKPGENFTKVGLFKWIYAGWSGLNMVEKRYIVDGCQRFASGLKEILEAPNLPGAAAIVDRISLIARMSEPELRERVKPLAALIEQKAPTDDRLSRSEFSPIIKDGGYVNILTPQEMQSELVKDYMRGALRNKSILQDAQDKVAQK